jgi:hypothetical protein
MPVVVPCELYNIILIAFYANSIGAHLNSYWTLHCIQLHFYWPYMYAYVKRMCNAYPRCALFNPNHGKSSELVYEFRCKLRVWFIHFDAYSASKHSSFEGFKVYLIICCGMCGFACMEPVTYPTATTLPQLL